MIFRKEWHSPHIEVCVLSRETNIGILSNLFHCVLFPFVCTSQMFTFGLNEYLNIVRLSTIILF